MDNNTILDSIQNRRSTYPKMFSGEKIDNDTIVKLIELANWAPTHRLTEPWRFIVFSGDAMQDLIQKQKDYFIANSKNVEEAQKKLVKFEISAEKTSHIIAINMQRDAEKRIPEWEEIAATSMAVQNIYLALAEFNIGGYWCTGNGTNSAEMREYLNISENDLHLGWFYLGVPEATEAMKGYRKPIDSKIEWR